MVSNIFNLNHSAAEFTPVTVEVQRAGTLDAANSNVDTGMITRFVILVSRAAAAGDPDAIDTFHNLGVPFTAPEQVAPTIGAASVGEVQIKREIPAPESRPFTLDDAAAANRLPTAMVQTPQYTAAQDAVAAAYAGQPQATPLPPQLANAGASNA